MAKPQLLEEVGKVSELKTNNKTIVGGINEVLEKEKSNAEQINILTEAKTVNYSDIDNLKETGLHMFIGDGTEFANGALVNLQVIAGKWNGVNPSVTQIATITYKAGGKRCMKFRTFYIGTWSPWITVQDQLKEAIMLTPQTGYKIDSQDCFIMGGVLYINCIVSMANGYPLTKDTVLEVFTVPSSYSSLKSALAVSYGGVSYAHTGGSVGRLQGGTFCCNVVNQSGNVYGLIVSGCIPL